MSGEMPHCYVTGDGPSDTLQTDSPVPLNMLSSGASENSSMDYVLNSGSLNLHLSSKEQAELMAGIEAIFQSDGELPSEDQEMADDDDEEPKVDLEDQQKRTEKLKGILPTLAQLWWCRSEHIDLAAEKLADGSRNSKWRVPLGNSGILNFFLQIFSTHTLGINLRIHTLRLIGNACADTDENRARVVSLNCFPSIIAQLDDSSTLPFAIPVLYNICLDYQPAQKQASDCSLTKSILALFTPSRKWEIRPFFGYIRKLAELLITQPSEFELAPGNAPVLFLRVAAYSRENASEMEDFVGLVNLALAYLQHVKFQQELIACGALDIALTVLVNSYTRFDAHPLLDDPATAGEDEAAVLQQMRSNLNQVLSDVSALPEFTEAVPVVSPFSSSLRRWLSSPQLQLQVCACIMLGNLARSDAACEEFVHTGAVHKPLIRVLTNANDPQLLHAALGFLKNLALPAKNKEAIGDAGVFDVLPRLWLLDTSHQIQFSSISLARQLLNGTLVNVQRICKELSEDRDSPAHMRSKLSLLMALFERTDVEPIKVEIARLITAVCRVFNTLKDSTVEHNEHSRKRFLEMHPDIGRPLSFMVSQDKWPVLRSEGWFVFALMSRYPEGAQCIGDLMYDVPVFEPLVYLLTGKKLEDYRPALLASSSPGLSSTESSTIVSGLSTGSPLDLQTPESVKSDAQSEEMAKIDRQNALVLVSELLRNMGSEMAVVRKVIFEDLLRGGANTLIASKGDASDETGPAVQAPATPGQGPGVPQPASY